MKPDNQHSHLNAMVSIPAGICLADEMKRSKCLFALVCRKTFFYSRR
jgi:hypothetical protein